MKRKTLKCIKGILVSTLITSLTMSTLSLNVIANVSFDNINWNEPQINTYDNDNNGKTTVIVKTGSNAIADYIYTQTRYNEIEDGETFDSDIIIVEASSSNATSSNAEWGYEEGRETRIREKTEYIQNIIIPLTTKKKTVSAKASDSNAFGDLKSNENDKKYDYITILDEDLRTAWAKRDKLTINAYDGKYGNINMESIVPEKYDSRQHSHISVNGLFSSGMIETGNEEKYDYQFNGWGEVSWIGYEDSTLNHMMVRNMKEVDPTVFATYCIDKGTNVIPGYWYKLENLDTNTYYPTEEAEDYIRGIVTHGYWGTVSGTGSLSTIKDELKEARKIAMENNQTFFFNSDEDIDSITEGQALSATQLAIWKYSNLGIDAEIDRDNFWFDYRCTYEEEEKAKDNILNLMNYLCLIEEPATETELITDINFVEENSMKLTIKERIECSDDNDEDVYNTDLSFALATVPNDKDDLIIKLVSVDEDDNEDIIVEVNLNETDDTIIKNNGNGEFTLLNIPLEENADIKFKLKLEGTQYVERGVYVFISETYNEDSSQNLVGIAEGDTKVDVELNTGIKFSVKEGTIKEEHLWRNEWYEGREVEESTEETTTEITTSEEETTETTERSTEFTTEETTEEKIEETTETTVEKTKEDKETFEETITAPEQSTEDIIHESVSESTSDVLNEDFNIAVLPMTSDASVFWTVLLAISLLGLAVISIVDRKSTK